MSKRTIVGKCKLCQLEKKLCRSHIIPEFMFKPLYDEPGHKYHALSNIPEDKNRKLQVGFWENLLCEDCESKIEKNERYVRDLIFDENFPLVGEKYKDAFVLFNLDYKKLKLFQLSILWRASITNRKEFQKINLAERHKESLRIMILNNNPGKSYEYGCLMVAIFDENKWVQDLIMSPEFFKKGGHRFSLFIFGGFIWIFITSSHMNRFSDFKFSLNEDGKLGVQKVQLFKQTYLKHMIKELVDTGKLNS